MKLPRDLYAEVELAGARQDQGSSRPVITRAVTHSGGLAVRFVSLLLLVSCITLCAFVASSSAQSIEVPKGVGPLPDYSKGAKVGAIVTSQHINLYRTLLPAELAELVEQGEFAFEAVKAPREPGRYAVSWGSQGQLGSGGELKQIPPLPLQSGLFSPGTVVAGDQKQFAYEALWNTAASLWRYHSVAIGVSAYLFAKPTAQPHKVEFLLERIHPQALGGAPSTLQPVFREKISAIKPSVISGLAWLTLRYLGKAEDFVWVASPVVHTIRQVTGSNRSDQLFSGVFSPDDLLVWSGKVELVEPVSVSYVPRLVAVLDSQAVPVSNPSEGCLRVAHSAEAALTLQCQSQRFKNVGSWTPANTVMVLRGVYRIEVATRDPFSADSRQVLYVDRESGLPVYRMVWDQSGRLQRFSMGVMRSIELSEGLRVPTLAGQITAYNQDGRRLVLEYDTWTVCDRYVPGRALEDFDPSTFVKFADQPQHTEVHRSPTR